MAELPKKVTAVVTTDAIVATIKATGNTKRQSA